MSQQKFQKYFLNLNGYDDGSLLEKIFSILGLIQTDLLEVNHVTLHKILSLMLIIEIHEKDDVPFILQNLEKINNIRSRINNKAPADWTPEDFQRSTKRHNRKLKKH